MSDDVNEPSTNISFPEGDGTTVTFDPSTGASTVETVIGGDVIGSDTIGAGGGGDQGGGDFGGDFGGGDFGGGDIGGIGGD